MNMELIYQKRVYFKFYNFNHIFLDITFQRITLELFKSVFLYLNIYEVNIDSKIIENISLISALLNECQCAFFIIDITNTHSLKRIKDLLNIIKLNNYPYLHVILLENKIDLENSRKISKNDINQYLKLNPFIKRFLRSHRGMQYRNIQSEHRRNGHPAELPDIPSPGHTCHADPRQQQGDVCLHIQQPRIVHHQHER